MSIASEFIKKKVYVTQDYEGFPDLIFRVDWVFKFTDGTWSSIGAGRTDLDISAGALDSGSYVLAENVTDELLEQWVKERAFGSLWQDFVDTHSEAIARKNAEPSMTLLYDDGTSPWLVDQFDEAEVVTMRQAKLALAELGMLSGVEAFIAGMPADLKEKAEIEWNNASTVQKNSPLVQSITASMGLSPQEVDNLFILASTL